MLADKQINVLGKKTCQSDGTWSNCSVTTCNPPSLPSDYNQSCNDNNACTSGEKIQCDGTCGGGTNVICDDKNICTTDSCDPSSGCKYTVQGSHKECQGNKCVSVSNTINSCTDKCSNDSQCSNCDPRYGNSCDDNNACTSGETIQCDGTCGGGTNVNNCSNQQSFSFIVEIKANNNSSAISVTKGGSANISWNAYLIDQNGNIVKQADLCTIYLNGSNTGWTGSSGSKNVNNIISDQNYILSCSVNQSGNNFNGTSSVQIKVLTVNLTASPDRGQAPLN
ncbi:MAG: hypothetical protein RMK17_00570, partial [bacterium]|nr:hypothetical protein [bacterium]